MSNYRDTGSESKLTRAVRIVVPWALLIVIVLIVGSQLGRYLDARGQDGEGAASEESTATADPGAGSSESPDTSGETTGAPGAEDPGLGTVVVVAQGLNLRAEPMTSATVIKQLDADARLTLLEEGTGWYRVRDAAGDEGWVAAGGDYTRLEQ